MKRIFGSFLKSLRFFILFAGLAAVFSMCRPVDVFAQPIANITYNFSGYSIPAGAPALYTPDAGLLGTFYVKNPDGTLFVDAAGNYAADTNAVANFVATLASVYNIPGVTELNRTVETNYLVSAINIGLNDPSHTPAITTAVAAPAAVTVPDAASAVLTTATEPAVNAGATLIDVNITSQKLTYFVNGAPVLISDIVTGNNSGHNTPTGTFSIYSKQTSRTLKGPGYSAYVNYWMPFYKGFGLHDATWRGSFGGSIYQGNGSHGCVNMPKSTAEALYNTVNIGTPVVIHY